MQRGRTFDIEIIALKAHQDPIVVAKKKINYQKHSLRHRKILNVFFIFYHWS